MKKKPQPMIEPKAIKSRAEQLAAEGRTAYWVVVSWSELQAIVDHEPVDLALREQAIAHVHRDHTETAEAYAARVEDTGTCTGGTSSTSRQVIATGPCEQAIAGLGKKGKD